MHILWDSGRFRQRSLSRGLHVRFRQDVERGVPYCEDMFANVSAIGLVASDLPRTLSFYRAMGLDIPADADSEPHVEVTLPSGFRILFDPESTIKSFDPEWTAAPAGSPRTALAFECASPAEVDAT